MACGKPNIGPYCSSFIELIGDGEKDPNARGLLSSIGEWQMIENGSERFLVNEKDLASKMKRLYSDEKLRERFSKNAIKFANQFTWEKICLQWNDLLKGMK
jgi:glycosyltransferase involved in cell wall biosynthesis